MERDEGRACHTCVVAGESTCSCRLMSRFVRCRYIEKGSCLRLQVYNLCLQQMATPSLQAGTMHAWISMSLSTYLSDLVFPFLVPRP